MAGEWSYSHLPRAPGSAAETRQRLPAGFSGSDPPQSTVRDFEAAKAARKPEGSFLFTLMAFTAGIVARNANEVSMGAVTVCNPLPWLDISPAACMHCPITAAAFSLLF